MIRLAILFFPVVLALPGCGPGAGRAGGAQAAESPAEPASVEAGSHTRALATGVTLHFLEAGAPGGQVVLFLHGYTDTIRSFGPTIEQLRALRPDLHIYALDQRGHGGSSMPPARDCAPAPEKCFQVSDFVADAMAFLDAVGADRAVVVGHSMGSMIAQEMALRHPERVERLVLISTTSNAAASGAVRDFILGQMIEGMWKPALEAAGKRFPENVYELTPADADPQAATWLAENWVTEVAADPAYLATIEPVHIKLGTWIGAARALLSFDTTERLKELRVPVLVLWATQDALFPEAPDQRALLAALAIAAERHGTAYRFKQYGVRPLPGDMNLDDIGHNLHWGAADPVARDIAEYVRTGEPTRDRVSVDPENPRALRIEPGQAVITAGPVPRQ